MAVISNHHWINLKYGYLVVQVNSSERRDKYDF